MSESVDSNADRARYFVVNLGRCGSSLLSAVLADANADFGLSVPGTWDPRTGQMEGAEIKLAAHEYRRAYDIGAGRKFIASPVLERKYRLQRARRSLRVALARGRYLKIGDLDLCIQPAFKLGYEPTVILNFRQLESMLPSLLVGRTHVGPDELAEEYVRVYRQGLMLLRTFGGCVVEYNELLDPECSRWAQALGTVTGCASDALLEARGRRVQGRPDSSDTAPLYAQAWELYCTMRGLNGTVTERSRQVTRAIAARS